MSLTTLGRALIGPPKTLPCPEELSEGRKGRQSCERGDRRSCSGTQGRRAGAVRHRGKSDHLRKVITVSMGRSFGLRNVMKVLTGPPKTLLSMEETSEGRNRRQTTEEGRRTEFQGDSGTPRVNGGTGDHRENLQKALSVSVGLGF